jgi:hypothetical protein
MIKRSILINMVLNVQASVIYPPASPKEYSYSLKQYYTATSLERPGFLLDRQVITAYQYWSLAKQSSRGVVASGAGFDKGVPTTALNQITVSNFLDKSDRASLVMDLVTHKCSFTKIEGGSSYTGYDGYTNQWKAAVAGGLSVSQYNDTDWEYDGRKYGPVEDSEYFSCMFRLDSCACR